MIQEIQIVQDKIFNKLNLTISYITKDLECDEYFGYNFKLDQFNIKFRKAKVTSKKIGQFVRYGKEIPKPKKPNLFNITMILIFILFTQSTKIIKAFSFSARKL